jgi:hypothetical protein
MKLSTNLMGPLPVDPVCIHCRQSPRGKLRTAYFHEYDPYCSYLCQHLGALASARENRRAAKLETNDTI